MDNEARIDGRLRALSSLVERAAAAGPLVLLVEDIQWATGRVRRACANWHRVRSARLLVLLHDAARG